MTVAARRLAAQLLTGPPADSPEAVVQRLLAVQAQDGRGFRLAVRSRSSVPSAADVDAALTDRRTLVVSWLNRGTLHLVGADDYWWLHQLTAPRLVTANTRRLRQEGVSERQADRGVDTVMSELAAGPRTRAELRVALRDAGVPTDGQALVHVLMAASVRHRVVRGPVVDGEQAFVDASTWLPAPVPVDRDEALCRLAVRYLAGHGPAGERDLATWAGVSLGDARRGLSMATAELSNTAGLLDLREKGAATAMPPPRLLGSFDPVLHGWCDRSFLTGRHTGVVTTNGLFRPFALVRGRAVATWSLRDGRVALAPLAPISQADLVALRADAAAVVGFLGVPGLPGSHAGRMPVSSR